MASWNKSRHSMLIKLKFQHDHGVVSKRAHPFSFKATVEQVDEIYIRVLEGIVKQFLSIFRMGFT